MQGQKEELSVFVDESGSFDTSIVPSRFYLVTCLFHNQRDRIGSQLEELEGHLSRLGFQNAYLHAGPLIRREEAFRGLDLTQRRRLFSCLVAFTRKCPISYKVFMVDKKFLSTPGSIGQSLLGQMSSFFLGEREWLESFQKVKIYYDNGQQQVKNLLLDAFSPFNIDFPPLVTPEKYRLFQSADLICTVELIKQKLKIGLSLTKSESTFFPSVRTFRKAIARPLERLARQPFA